MLNYKSDKVRILFNFLEKSSVQYNGETANEKLRYTYNTVGVDADGLWITLHSRMDKSEVQTMQDVGDAMALAGYAATLSVVGAEVGVPLAYYGNSLSGLGSFLELGVDWINGEHPSILLSDIGFLLLNTVDYHWYSPLLKDLPEETHSIIKQGNDLKNSLLERIIDAKINTVINKKKDKE